MIGIFDSGYGGVSIAKQLFKDFPDENFIYLGDNARAPYGGHGKETIINYSKQAVDFLFSKGAKTIIFACFSASSVALREIQLLMHNKLIKENKRVLGIIIPLAEHVAQKNSNIGVIATKATVASNAFETEINKTNNQIKVISRPTPLLVPFIEEGMHKKPEFRSILKKYLRPLKSHNFTSLILGCTHYSIVKNNIKKYMGKNIEIINTEKVVSEKLKAYLRKHPGINTNNINTKSQRFFYTTDSPKMFQDNCQKMFNIKILDNQIQKTNLN